MITAARRAGSRLAERDALLIMMAYRHGFRASELVALRWDQIDLKVGTLHVARLKHGSPSTHPLRGPELRALRAWKRDQGDATQRSQPCFAILRSPRPRHSRRQAAAASPFRISTAPCRCSPAPPFCHSTLASMRGLRRIPQLFNATHFYISTVLHQPNFFIAKRVQHPRRLCLVIHRKSGRAWVTHKRPPSSRGSRMSGSFP